MKKFEGMLFCTDLDGTLYANDKTVSKENMDAISYFKAEGGLFTFITGRVAETSMEICRTVMPNAPFGCINGGGIYDPCKNQYLWYDTLPGGFLELVRAVDASLPEIAIQFDTEQGIYFYKDNSAMQYFRHVTGVENRQCSCEGMGIPTMKIVFAHDDPEQIEALAHLLQNHPLADRFDFIRSEQRLYEILPKNTSKGSVLVKLAKLLNVPIERTIAVGDYNNDVAMLKRAGLSFAVSNAVAEAKAVAKHITVSNNEHAIAAIVDGLDRGIYQI